MKNLDFAQIWHTSTLGDPNTNTKILGSSSHRNPPIITFQNFGPKMAIFHPFFLGNGTTTQSAYLEKRLLLRLPVLSGYITRRFTSQRRQGWSCAEGPLTTHFLPLRKSPNFRTAYLLRSERDPYIDHHQDAVPHLYSRKIDLHILRKWTTEPL